MWSSPKEAFFGLSFLARPFDKRSSLEAKLIVCVFVLCVVLAAGMFLSECFLFSKLVSILTSKHNSKRRNGLA